MPGGVGVRAVFDGDCVMELCADGGLYGLVHPPLHAAKYLWLDFDFVGKMAFPT